VVAVTPKILVAIYHMLSHQVCYHELGDLYLDKLNKHHVTRNLVRRLERLGYTVTLEIATSLTHTSVRRNLIFVAVGKGVESSNVIAATAYGHSLGGQNVLPLVRS
jgi:hypothetical protein